MTENVRAGEKALRLRAAVIRTAVGPYVEPLSRGPHLQLSFDAGGAGTIRLFPDPNGV